MIGDALAAAGLFLGVTVSAVGVIGLYRFPDVYTRLNLLAKVTAVGALGIHLCAAWLMPRGEAGKGVLTAVVLLLTTPVVTQVIASAAHRLRVPDINRIDELRDREPPTPPGTARRPPDWRPR